MRPGSTATTPVLPSCSAPNNQRQKVGVPGSTSAPVPLQERAPTAAGSAPPAPQRLVEVADAVMCVQGAGRVSTSGN
jgi:hypothetical protein